MSVGTCILAIQLTARKRARFSRGEIEWMVGVEWEDPVSVEHLDKAIKWSMDNGVIRQSGNVAILESLIVPPV